MCTGSRVLATAILRMHNEMCKMQNHSISCYPNANINSNHNHNHTNANSRLKHTHSELYALYSNSTILYIIIYLIYWRIIELRVVALTVTVVKQMVVD